MRKGQNRLRKRAADMLGVHLSSGLLLGIPLSGGFLFFELGFILNSYQFLVESVQLQIVTQQVRTVRGSGWLIAGKY
jgi:hypothetical protein